MTAAIVHYHLDPGGVSRVIADASRVLTAAGVRHVILIGNEETVARASCPEPSNAPIRTIPGLGYLPNPGNLTAASLATQLRAAACETLGRPPKIWHFHNHSLGKNALLTEVVTLLAMENERIVLQIHDLAEDGRPENYGIISDNTRIYPFSPRIQYAFLNSRDLQIFTTAGLPRKNACILANPINPSSQSKILNPQSSTINQYSSPHSPPLLFAPIRGIRRKNLGELVLLAALAPEGTRVAISRAPLDPAALAIHDRWSRLARREGLPIGFGVTDRFMPASRTSASFESWLSHSTHIITTSVSEGFGLPFLEAAANGKPLLGRNIKHLTNDHADHEIRTGNLYDQLLIPLDWIDFTILRDHLKTTLERNYRFYKRRLTRETPTLIIAALIHHGWLDFGNLPEPLQQGVIERMKDPASRYVPLVKIGTETHPAIEWLAAAIENRTPTATPDQLDPYTIDFYQKNITTLYTRLSRRVASTVQFVPPDKILSHFLAPDAFHFLLSSIGPSTKQPPYRAVVFDIYGTLLIAPEGGVKPDPDADPKLREILKNAGYDPPESPSTELHAAVLRHHAAAQVPYPEVDLRILWREVLSIDPGTDLTDLVETLENAWHPAKLMPGAEQFIGRLARSGISLGLLSNAQCNTLSSLGGIAELFAQELTILSYQYGVAKPSPELFQMLTDRLAGRRITPEETLYIGNDPINDIAPAAAHGFKTALFTGHPQSIRPGNCNPNITLTTFHPK